MNGDYYYTVFLFVSAEGSKMFSQIVLSFASLLLSVYFLSVEHCKISFNAGIDPMRKTCYLCFRAKGTQLERYSERSLMCPKSHSGNSDPSSPGERPSCSDFLRFRHPYQYLRHWHFGGRGGTHPSTKFLPPWTSRFEGRNTSISFLGNLH